MSLLDFLLGRPLATEEQSERKLGVFAGVPALGLDGLSSSAYGPGAALAVLLPLGAAGLHYIGLITLVILTLLAILTAGQKIRRLTGLRARSGQLLRMSAWPHLGVVLPTARGLRPTGPRPRPWPCGRGSPRPATCCPG